MQFASHNVSNFAEILASESDFQRLGRDVLYAVDQSNVNGAVIGPMQSYEHSFVAESACIITQLGLVAQAASHIFSDIHIRTDQVTRRLDKMQSRVRKAFDESNVVYKKFSDSNQFLQLLRHNVDIPDVSLESTKSVFSAIVEAGDSSSSSRLPPSPLSEHVIGQRGRIQQHCSNMYSQSLEKLPKDLPLLDKLEKYMQYPLVSLYSYPDGYVEDWMQNLNQLKRQKKAKKQEKASLLPSAQPQRSTVHKVARQTSKDMNAFIGHSAAGATAAVQAEQPIFYDVAGSKDMQMFARHPVDFHAAQYSGSGPPPSFLVGSSAPPPPSARAMPLQPSRQAPPRPQPPAASAEHELPSQPERSPTLVTPPSASSQDAATVEPAQRANPPPPPNRTMTTSVKAPPPPPRPVSIHPGAQSQNPAPPTPPVTVTPPPPPPPPAPVVDSGNISNLSKDKSASLTPQPANSLVPPPPPPPPPVSALPPSAPPPPPAAGFPPPPPPPAAFSIGTGGGGGGGNALMAAIAGNSGLLLISYRLIQFLFRHTQFRSAFPFV
jgi:hypothetical protein